MKRVSVKDFEETLKGFIGTPYVKGFTDCSGLIRNVLGELGATNKSSVIGSAATIMRTLTVDKRNPKDARP